MTSVAQDIPRCYRCETDVVQLHCNVCDVHVCKECVEIHLASNLRQKHDICRFQDRKLSDYELPNCELHAEKKCDLFCRSCSKPFCSKCAYKGSHKDHNVEEVLEICQATLSKLKKDVFDIDDGISKFESEIAQVNDKLTNAFNRYESIRVSVIKQGEKWHTAIDTIVKKLTTELAQFERQDVAKLRNLQLQLKNSMSHLQRKKECIIKLFKTRDKTSTVKILHHETKSDDIKVKCSKDTKISLPTFSVRNISFEKLENLFGVLLKPHRQQYHENVTRLCEKVLNVTDLYSGMCATTDICCLNTEHIFTSGCISDNYIFLVHIDGSLVKEIKLDDIPKKITIDKCGNVFFILKDKCIFQYTERNETVTPFLKFENWCPKGLAFTMLDDLLISMCNKEQSKVVRYNGKDIKQEIWKDQVDRPLFKGAASVSENRNGDICVCDNGADCVFVLDRYGILRFCYKGITSGSRSVSQHFQPIGIASDSSSNILITDDFNKHVHIINENGYFLRLLEGFTGALSICVDAEDKLWLLSVSQAKVYVMRYKQSNNTF